MPRKIRKAIEPVDPSTLYSTEALSGEEQALLRDAELLIRRWKLRLKMFPKKQAALWSWDYFIEAIGATKASIEMGIVPCLISSDDASEEARWSQMIANYQKAYDSRPVDNGAIIREIDKLLGSGVSTRELILRLQGDSAKPRARYAESWTVEASGLFDVKGAHA